MATYIGIKGIEIQTIAGDPANPVVGQVWYNTTTNTLKGRRSAVSDGAWASAPAVNTGRTHAAGTGTQTASIWAGGYAAPLTLDKSETYDGSSWSEGNDINTARRTYHMGAGTVTAALIAGGYTPGGSVANAETYDGTCWTATTALTTARYTQGGGTQIAALAISGQASPGLTTFVEEWNGSTWTEKADVNTAVRRAPAVGTTTAALKFAGNPGYFDLTEQFDGTTWTEVADLNTGRVDPAAAGTSTLALCYGGAPYGSKTESWDGTSWTELANMATARQGLGGGTNLQSAALGMGGTQSGGAHLTATEAWSVADATKTFTSS